MSFILFIGTTGPTRGQTEGDKSSSNKTGTKGPTAGQTEGDQSSNKTTGPTGGQ
jgi:hypothetical protein